MEVELTRRVCSSGPHQEIAKAQRQRGEAALTVAGVLPNPSLVVEHQQSLSGPDERETIAGLSVPLGISGRRSLLKDAASARNEQAAADANATLFETALDFREAYANAVAADTEVRILAEQQASLDALSNLVQALTRGGETAGYDLLRQQTQARIHQRLLESATANAKVASARLALWTGKEIPLADEGINALIADGPRISTLSAPAPDTPQVRGLEAAARASGLEAQAARRRWVPDVDVFAGYRSVAAGGSTGQGIALRLAMPLTFFDHGQGEAAEARAERSLAQASAASLRLRNDLEAKVYGAHLRQLVSQLGSAAQLSVDAKVLQTTAQKLYSAGETPITELLEAFRSAEEARLSELKLARDVAEARLGLLRTTGTLFDPALDRLCGATARTTP